MGNRLAPGCCCETCLIFDVTFDTTVETSWVAKFDHYNAADELQTPSVGDALGTFTEGEYLLSKTPLPSKNWAADLTTLVPITFWDIDGNTLIVELIDASDVVRVSITIYPERDTVITGAAGIYYHFLRASVVIKNAAGTTTDSDVITIASYGSAIASPPNEFNFDERGFAFIVRDKCIEIGSEYSATGLVFGDAMSTFDVTSNPAGTVTRIQQNSMKRHPVFFDDSLPECTLSIRTLGDDLTLDQAFAERVFNVELAPPSGGAYYSESGAITQNTSCLDTATCDLIPPYCHVFWSINSIAITGMQAPLLYNRVFTGCGAVVQMRDDTPLPGYTFDDTQAEGSKYTFTAFTPPKAFNVDSATFSITDYDADEVELTIVIALRYDAIAPSTGTNAASGTVGGFGQFNVTGTYPLFTGYWFLWFGITKQITAVVRVPKWYGRDFSPITLTGSDFTVTDGNAGRTIWALSTATISDLGFGSYNRSVSNEAFDLDDLSITIGVST